VTIKPVSLPAACCYGSAKVLSMPASLICDANGSTVQITSASPCCNAGARELFDDADVVIFGGGPLAGLADRVKDRIDGPVIDPMAAAVKQAEALYTLNARKAARGALRRPGPKATIGLPDALARRLEHKDKSD
jgi:hypothetical protein